MKLLGKKILIVYYSRTGNTKEIAKQIQGKTGGDLFEIQTVEPYPKDYEATVEQVKKEQTSGFLPKLKTKAGDIDSYDLIFLGSPCWWAQLAPPVSSFLSIHDLQGKTIIPFMTSVESGLGSSVLEIKKLEPKSTVTNAKNFVGQWEKNPEGTKKAGSDSREVIEWISELKL